MNKNTHFSLQNYKFLLPLSGLVVAVVLITIAISAKGAALVALEEEKRDLEHDNRLLTAQLVEKTSLSRIAEKSQEMGLKKPDVLVYLNNEIEVATLPH